MVLVFALQFYYMLMTWHGLCFFLSFLLACLLARLPACLPCPASFLAVPYIWFIITVFTSNLIVIPSALLAGFGFWFLFWFFRIQRRRFRVVSYHIISFSHLSIDHYHIIAVQTAVCQSMSVEFGL